MRLLFSNSVAVCYATGVSVKFSVSLFSVVVIGRERLKVTLADRLSAIKEGQEELVSGPR
jgi:hypothetical protein